MSKDKLEVIPKLDLIVAAKTINVAGERAQHSARAGLAYALLAGKMLVEVSVLQKGTFDEWLKVNCPKISKVTAYRYIKIVKKCTPQQVRLIPDTIEAVEGALDKLQLPAASLKQLYEAHGMVKVTATKRGGKATAPKIEKMDLNDMLVYAHRIHQWVKHFNTSLSSKDAETLGQKLRDVLDELYRDPAKRK